MYGGGQRGPVKKKKLLKTNISPENWWLGDDPFLLGPGLFSGALAVSFRQGSPIDYLTKAYEAIQISNHGLSTPLGVFVHLKALHI